MAQTEQIIHTILGENYILIERLITDNMGKKKIEGMIKRHECIYQGIKEVSRGWVSGHAIVKILVPERNILQFNRDD